LVQGPGLSSIEAIMVRFNEITKKGCDEKQAREQLRKTRANTTGRAN